MNREISSKGVYQAWCMGCCCSLHPMMLTGYCVTGCCCDHCGTVSDLALVKLEPNTPSVPPSAIQHLDFATLGRELLISATEFQAEGNPPDVETAYQFLLANPECFTHPGPDDVWPPDMPQEPPADLKAAYEDGYALLDAWGLQDPDSIGSSEYRAVYEVLGDALGESVEITDTPLDFALVILGEFISHAESIAEELAKRYRHFNRERGLCPICHHHGEDCTGKPKSS